MGSTLVAALDALGVDASLVQPWRPLPRLSYPWKAALLPVRGAALVGSALRARSMGADLVHLHYARFGWQAPFAGSPYLVHCHGSDVRGVTPHSAWGRLIAPWMSRARAVLYATPDLEPWVHAFRPDASFLPNPIELPPPGRAAASRVDLLVGVRLDAVKAADLVIETLRRLVAMRPATSVTIIAQGSLTEPARAAAPNARVIAPVPHREMPALMASHRAALGQMGVGALGNYELEAMAAGLATAAAFRFPGAYDAPPPLVEVTDPAGTATRIAAILDDEPRRASLGAAARGWVEGHHAAPAVARRVADLYAALGVRAV